MRAVLIQQVSFFLELELEPDLDGLVFLELPDILDMTFSFSGK